MRSSLRSVFALIFAGVMVSLAGCGQRDGIRKYTVKKIKQADQKAKVADPHVMPETPVDTGPPDRDRMLAAIVPHGKVGWFFKMTGPREAVGKKIEEFAGLIQSLKFGEGDDAKPEWTLPEGWTEEKKEGSIRFATLRVEVDGETLELTVIPLPADDPTSDEYVLANVNRWCEQMGLPPKTKADLAEDKQPPSSEIQRISVGGVKVTLVSLIGRMKSTGMGAAPFAQGQGPRRPAEVNPPRDSPDAGLPKWTLPDGWKMAAGNQFSLAAFEATDGDSTVKTTVSKAGGDLLANVNRWRMQLGLPAWSADEMAKSVSKLLVDGTDGTFVELTGTDARTGKPSSTFGVVVPRGDDQWFFKLSGDPKLAHREKANFESFVQSVKFGM